MKSTPKRLRVAILGSGNIGTDLAYKVAKDDTLELSLVAGIDPTSDGLARAKELGADTTTDGAYGIIERGNIDVVLDATSARSHLEHESKLREAGMKIIDLTPAKVGPSVVPSVNLDVALTNQNINLISCAAQATIPLIHGFSRVAPVAYAEIVSTLASKGAGLAARQNIEEFKRTTERAIVDVGGAERSKAMIIFNPAEPPIVMRNAIYVKYKGEVDDALVVASIMQMERELQRYVPGYRVTVAPFRRKDHFMVNVEVTGNGDYLPKYAGNLDIINAAAIAVLHKHAAAAVN